MKVDLAFAVAVIPKPGAEVSNELGAKDVEEHVGPCSKEGKA